MLKNQIKNEIKNEIEKEVKEELKAELVNKIFLSSSNSTFKIKNIPNLKIPINTEGTTYEFIRNNTYNNDGKNIDINTNRSISSIDILFPANKTPSTINTDISPKINNSKKIKIYNYNNKDNLVMKKLVRLYNNTNKRDNNNNSQQIEKNKSFQYQKNNNIYHKIPVLNNSIYYNTRNKQEQNDSYNYIKTENNIIKANNKIIKINNNNYNNYNNQIINSKSNSPRIKRSPFRKIIVKNSNNINMNEKIPKDKIIKIPKKIIKDIEYIDNGSIIINNKTNNIVYIKHVSPARNSKFDNTKIYERKKYINRINKNNQY